MRVRHIIKRALSSLCYFMQISGAFDLNRQSGFRILLYHSVDTPDSNDRLRIRVSPEDFYEQMKFLHHNGYKIFTLDEIIEIIQNKRDIPEKAIAITFDDGYKDVLENAVPVLCKFNFKAAVFIATDYIEKKDRFGLDYWEKWKFLSWEEIEKMKDLDIEIGSHSVSHMCMSELPGEDVKKEVIGSKKILENKITGNVRFFSYPHGSFDGNLKNILKTSGYAAAFTSIEGVNSHETDLFKFKRIEINGDDNISEFNKKITGCYDCVGFFRKKKDG